MYFSNTGPVSLVTPEPSREKCVHVCVSLCECLVCVCVCVCETASDAYLEVAGTNSWVGGSPRRPGREGLEAHAHRRDT